MGMRKTVHSKAHAAFCRVITAARQNAKMTQTELAAALRKPQSFVAKIETGERRVDVIEFLTIAAAIGQDAVKLLSQLKRELRDQALRSK
jgi:transcriptional regulator with XRE-family HTH domain